MNRRPVPKRVRKAARRMLKELATSRLEVIKFRKEDSYGQPVWKRVALCSNPPWYSDLCNSELRTRKKYRKARTIIRRMHTVAALKAIASGWCVPERLYVARLLDVIKANGGGAMTHALHERIRPVRRGVASLVDCRR
jgi:hypothetical protein